MRRHHESENLSYEPPKKKSVYMGSTASSNMFCGEIIVDKFGKEWRLGEVVGVGGFGEIYLVSDVLHEEVENDAPYVAKFEPHESGPLFVEINCYLRIAKRDMINAWKTKQKLSNLGMPHYVASGSYQNGETKYRFLIIPRFKMDLEKMLCLKQKFNLKTVLTVSRQILDVLQYIHKNGYVHSDVKASNILIEKCKQSNEATVPTVNLEKACIRYQGFNPLRTCKIRKINRSLRPNCNLRYVSFPVVEKVEKPCTGKDQVYLSDYGLASKYLLSNGEHKPYCIDQRKAHAGTLLFCSRDAHNGAQARRSDLESLGYNIIYWLTSSLPWSNMIDNDPETIHRKKQHCVENIDEFLGQCFTQVPHFLYKYFQYLLTLDFEAEPDYNYCKSLFKNALKDYGYVDNSKLDFDNLEGDGQLIKKINVRTENAHQKRKVRYKIKRSPLKSNLPIKPILRKKDLKKNTCKISWSKILSDPEVLLKKRTKERKTSETNDNAPANRLNIYFMDLNPTYAMLEVYNKSKERINNYCGSSPAYKGDTCLINHIDGYTPAMMAVYKKKVERQELELEQALMKTNKPRRTIRNRKMTERAKNSYLIMSPTKLQMTKPSSAVNKDTSTRKKPPPSRRIYSLRG